MLPRRHRLTRPDQFQAVLRGGRGRSRRASTQLLVVHRRDGDADAVNPETATVRVGFVVSRAVGNSIVRHRVTRRLRALASESLAALPPGTDLVVRANPAAAQASYPDLRSAFRRALDRSAAVQGER